VDQREKTLASLQLARLSKLLARSSWGQRYYTTGKWRLPTEER